MRDTVVVFARAPRLGAVKRRLAREIGDRAALRFHVATLTRLLRPLTADRRFRTILAVTPDHARFRLPVRVERMAQGSGDLGERMHRAFRRFPRGRVAIIGCDIPDAGPQDARSAFRALGRAPAVFGPAADGGYWLVAMSPRRPAHPFAAVRWSTAHALADTLANFSGRRVIMLRTLHDVDTAADLRRSPTMRRTIHDRHPHRPAAVPTHDPARSDRAVRGVHPGARGRSAAAVEDA
ncbi:MAG TPA: TIGR04282 family arsenosugar biosynthesis glycosyltransferase [Acetobacteraceae bacterium]|nr:TIGR04282 family arsenosugar biosynthesis glycosyltransferase [Acetobacteraceae bacterium]